MTTRAVVLVHYRPGVTGQAARTVHLVPHPGGVTPGTAVSSLCGALLACEQIETIAPGEGMPCTMCLLLRTSSAPEQPPALSAEPDPDGGSGAATLPQVAAVDYRAWGWPVTVCRDQVTLDLDRQVAALIIPIGLAAGVEPILATRRCPSPVLAHPDAPAHRVVLAGEPYGVALPWPPQVQQATGTLPLPPSVTPRGPITWVHLPAEAHALRLCREIDLFAAVRTSLREPSPPS